MSEMADFLKKNLSATADSDSITSTFLNNHISGAVFLELTEDELREVIPCLGDRKEVKRLQDRFSGSVVSIE